MDMAMRRGPARVTEAPVRRRSPGGRNRIVGLGRSAVAGTWRRPPASRGRDRRWAREGVVMPVMREAVGFRPREAFRFVAAAYCESTVGNALGAAACPSLVLADLTRSAVGKPDEVRSRIARHE